MIFARRISSYIGTALGLFIAAHVGGTFAMSETSTTVEATDPPAETETATFANGCFWCTEAVFQRLKGVKSVASGYSGGSVKNPTYRRSAPARRATPRRCRSHITRKRSLMKTSSRSSVTRTTRPQKIARATTSGRSIARRSSTTTTTKRNSPKKTKKKLDASGLFRSPIVTEIVPFSVFYRAEDYHQNYYNEHKRQPYCRAVIGPKLEKLRKAFHDKLKTDATK